VQSYYVVAWCNRYMDPTTELELVQRARAGDVNAFETLYRAYNDRIYNFAKRVTGSAEDAGDVTQETFVRAWNALTRLRVDDTFGVWLHRIALNRCRDFIKKRARDSALSIDATQPDADGEPMRVEIEGHGLTPEQELISGEVRNAVVRAVDSLNAEHRMVVTMHHMEGMDVEEISAVLGVPKGTVMSRLSRAREALRRKLSPYVEVSEHATKKR
jgi:RNA polymerase sigma-70 factor (ECF subfamily)